ncbi:heterokaryon incompatibility protein-domain-containing protein [Podospora fimiseda]|uniref:Heterokaryon incompatibility protein-domain-containing protein n=1 Tax=Podospora fimiseda TaxID=252190 RepID=A0AAN7BPW7_9PEZI|nr:heterokaryon incompatibility protein-domain-containing protein [Podospora fimiseda]
MASGLPALEPSCMAVAVLTVDNAEYTQLVVFRRPSPSFKSSHYDLLSNTAPEIRLIDLHPATSRWEIQVTLRTVSLAENPSSQALSYERGDPKRLKTITVNGKLLKLTENLANSLHNIRHETEVRMLWVDAISINQRSQEEKAQQVPLMSLIYRRAKNVLVLLGDHPAPGWIAKQKEWNERVSLAWAEDYWNTAEYWLTRLALEYWNRCWIVQEIGVAVDIDIYFARQAIPWSGLVTLMRMFQENRPRSTLPGRVLWLQDLRENCRGDCPPINYPAGPRPLYEAIMSFYNSLMEQSKNAKVEMVRWLLSRRQTRVAREYKKPGLLCRPETWGYYWCGDDSIDLCIMGPEILLLLPVLDYFHHPFSAFKDYTVETSLWLEDTAEDKSVWQDDSGITDTLEVFNAVRFIAGEVQELGPSYQHYLQYPSVPHQWSARLSARYPKEADQRHVLQLPGFEDESSHTDPGARLFLGGEDIIMGLVPSNTQVGDKLCQFWNSSSIAVLRHRQNASGESDVVGRGAMLQHGNQVNWDVLTNKIMFLPGSSDKVIELRLSFQALNHLSFDIVGTPTL